MAETIAIISDVVSSLGVPVAFSLYLLLRSSKEHKQMDSTLNTVNTTLGSLKEAIVALRESIMTQGK